MLTRVGLVHWISRLFHARAQATLRQRRATPAPFSAWVNVLESRALLSASPTVPFTLNAPTALADQGIYVAMYGSVASPVWNSNSLTSLYAIEWDTSGTVQQVTDGGSVEVEKLNFMPNAKQPGSSTCTILIPDIPNGNSDMTGESIPANTYQLNGARLVFGIGHSPYLSVGANGGVAAPAPSSLNDPNIAQNYDFVEFTLDQAGMHINTSTVDQFGFPITVSASPVTSIAAGSNGTVLSNTPFDMSVASTAGFASQGQVQVMINGQVETINYTGRNDQLNEFTGCTSTGSGTLEAGQTVWSVSTYITANGVGVQLDRQDVFKGFESTIGSTSPFYNSLVDGNTVSAGSIYLPTPASGYLSAHQGSGAVQIQVFNVSPNDPLLKVNFGTTQVSPTSATYDPSSKVTTLTVTPPSLTDTTVDVTVTSTGGTSAAYPSLDYYVFGTGGTPTVTGLSAATGPLTGGNMVIIKGTNFRDPNAIGSNCQVLFGGTPAAFTVLSSTAIQAYVPASATAGQVTVTVQNNNQTATNTPAFTYIDQLPVVTGLSPNNAAPGSTITVTGLNFVAGQTTVKFGSLAGTNVQVTSPTSLTVQVPEGGKRTVEVTVTTPAGTSPITFSDRFTYPSAPVYSAASSLRLVNPSDILIIESSPPVAQYAKCEPGGQLTPNTTYYYVVTATSNTGESIASNVQAAEASGIPGYNSIALAWSPFLNATGYNVYRSTSATGPFEYLAHVNAGQSSKFLDDGTATPVASQNPPTNIYTYDPLAGYFDSALITFFNHYAPVKDGGDGATFSLTYGGNTFTGTTNTDITGTYLSISGSDNTSCKIYRPLFNTNTNVSSYPPPPAGIPVTTETPGQMVFSGNGVFALNTGPHSPDIENAIVAAFNRGIATDFSIAPSDWGKSPADFYKAGSTANFYAGYMHQANVSISDARPASLGGPQPLAYGFSYDDQSGDGGNGYGSYFTTPAAPPVAGQPVPNGSFAITVNFGSWTPATRVEVVSGPKFDLNQRPLDFKVQLVDNNGAAVFQGGQQINLQVVGPHNRTTTYTLITNPDGTATGTSTSNGKPVEIVHAGNFSLSFTAPGLTTQNASLQVDWRSVQLKRRLMNQNHSGAHHHENFCHQMSTREIHTTWRAFSHSRGPGSRHHGRASHRH
jgi:hypothetical protein